MGPKYKIGDKIVLISDERALAVFGLPTPYAGQIITIVDIDCDEYQFKKDGTYWCAKDKHISGLARIDNWRTEMEK